MKRLLILGAGGHGRVVADAALMMGSYESVAFLDDRTDVGEVLGFPIVGRLDQLQQLVSQYASAAVALGDVQARLRWLARCTTIGFALPCIVHPAAAVSRFSTIGPGTVVFAQSAINAGAVVGRGCIVNTGASIDHDCVLEDGVHVCPGVRLAGNVRVGARTWIGIGSSVKQGINIGADVTVGAGAAVVADVRPGVVMVGVPARERATSL